MRRSLTFRLSHPAEPRLARREISTTESVIASSRLYVNLNEDILGGEKKKKKRKQHLFFFFLSSQAASQHSWANRFVLVTAYRFLRDNWRTVSRPPLRKPIDSFPAPQQPAESCSKVDQWQQRWGQFSKASSLKPGSASELIWRANMWWTRYVKFFIFL